LKGPTSTQPFCLEKIHGRRADEAGDELVRRLIVDRLRLVALLQDSILHDRDPLSHRHGLHLIVGDIDGGDAQAAMQADQLGSSLDAQLGVEVGERLVHEKDFGLAHDRAAQRDALPLAARKLLRPAMEKLLDAEHCGRLAHSRVDVLLDLARLAHVEKLPEEALQLAEPQAERNVVVHVHVRVKRVILKDHRDVSVLGGNVVDPGFADEKIARGGLFEPGDHA
jgi:hypothetical protein